MTLKQGAEIPPNEFKIPNGSQKKFLASAETSSGIDVVLDKIWAEVVPCLEREFGIMKFKGGDVELLYVPINMREKDRASYPARSKLKEDSRTCECCPQLNYQIFEDGNWEEVLHEYVGGLKEASSQLKKLGASDSEIYAFEEILNRSIKEMKCLGTR